jgi:hypothetical protein
MRIVGQNQRTVIAWVVMENRAAEPMKPLVKPERAGLAAVNPVKVVLSRG